MEHINFTLPEFCFLDGISHLGDTLKNRTVIQHVRSYTIVDVIAADEMMVIDLQCQKHEFTYTNFKGIKEKHILALHFTLAEDDQLDEIFEKIASWYCDYLNWEDKNIITDEGSKHN